MQVSDALVRDVVRQVLADVKLQDVVPRAATPRQATQPGNRDRIASLQVNGQAHGGAFGVFDCPEEAVAAARRAFEELSARPIKDRKRAVAEIRRVAVDQAVELGTLEMQETKIGRLEHKIEKIKMLGADTPGVEFLEAQAFSGDHGLTVIEHAPFGVIGAITPVTHSLPTITGNAIAMIAAGNTLAINPHPSGKQVAVEGVRRFNQAIYKATGLSNLLCIIAEPTLESADVLFNHRDVALICVTGGPGVARAALNSGKRAIVAGPGNPPVVVDETADLDNAAATIIRGASYDNNLLCIAEKEVFCVDAVCDDLMAAMERRGAVRLEAAEIDHLTKLAIATVGEGDRVRQAAVRDFIGQDAAELASAVGRQIQADTPLLFGEVAETNPFVAVEQMMPFLPIVRCPHVDDAIAKAKHYEHGYRHTSVIHTNNVRNMTKMGRAMDTTLFVKNGPSLASLGVGGEGYLSFSIATPTGEGVTTPLTFTRERRCSLIDDLHILGRR